MKIFLYFAVALLFVLLVLFIWTSVQVLSIEKQFSPSGQFAELEGGRMHYLDVASGQSDLPPVLFVHGASGNLKDQQEAFETTYRGNGG